MATVNYIVAFYCGARRHYGSTTPTIEFAKKQVEFLSKSPNLITKVTFVFNTSNNESERITLEYLDSIKLPMESEVVQRPNVGMSYGAWNEVISQTKSEFDYSFTIEDDYIPTRLDFVEYFLNKVNDDTIFVASLYDRNHAAISNGLFVNSKSYNPPFMINANNSYSDGGIKNQKLYLSKYTNNGYTIQDICEDGYTEFSDTNRIINYYGNRNGPLLIKPIL